MTQNPSCNFAAGGHVADQFDAARIRRRRRIYFLECTLHAIERRSQRDVTKQAGLAVGVNSANSRSHLIVAVRLDVFHQEVDKPRVALEDVKQLQCAVAYLRQFHGWFYGFRKGLDETELRSDIVWQNA